MSGFVEGGDVSRSDGLVDSSEPVNRGVSSAIVVITASVFPAADSLAFESLSTRLLGDPGDTRAWVMHNAAHRSPPPACWHPVVRHLPSPAGWALISCGRSSSTAGRHRQFHRRVQNVRRSIDMHLAGQRTSILLFADKDMKTVQYAVYLDLSLCIRSNRGVRQ